MSVTSPAVERAVAALLGADDAIAAAAVDALTAAGRLGEGIALHALLHAARRGTDAVGALGDLAAGATLPSGWSNYERRAAAEEAGDEVRVPGVGADAPDRLHVAVGADAPLGVLRAVGGGTTTVASSPDGLVSDGLAPVRARCDHDFVALLARWCGVRLVGRGRAEAAPSGGLDETAARSGDYLEVLGTR